MVDGLMMLYVAVLAGSAGVAGVWFYNWDNDLGVWCCVTLAACSTLALVLLGQH
nr:hypothetical protein [Mesorhizobium ciceri]